MTHPTAALALVWLMLLCCGCGADVLDGGWQFRESVELPEVPASDAGADTPIDEDPDLDEEPDLDDDPEPVEPIERICDGNLPPEMAVSEAGEDALAYSLAIGPDGCPHVAWSADDTIHYARWDGSAWVDEVVYGPSHWYTALWVGRDGRPTLLVSDDDEPRVLRLQRSADGAWVERERVTDRWTWGMRFVPVAPNRHALLTYTANKQYSGEDLALRVLTREGGEWRESRIVDFGIRFDRPLTLAVDSLGRGIVPMLENKGYGPSDRDTNLWVATSTDSTLGAWEAERVETPGFNQFGSASIVDVRGTPAIIALAEAGEEEGQRALLHIQPDDVSQWRTEQFASCSNRVCGYVRAAADSRGRIHALFEFGEPEEKRLRYALFDEGQWSFQDLGPYSNVQAALEVDPVTDAVHVVAARQAAPQVRNLTYLTVPSPQ